MQQIVNFYNYHVKVMQDGGKVDWHAVAQAQATRAQELLNQQAAAQQPKPLPAAVAEASREPRGKRPKKSAAKQKPE